MNFIQKITISVFFLLTFHCVSGQQIQTDRPNETESPSAVKSKHFQIESGISYEKDNTEKKIQVPEMVLRFGIVKNLEVRAENALKITNEDQNTLTGIQPVVLGLKYHFLDHKGLIVPDLAILGRISIPWMADPVYKEQKYSPEIRMLAQNELSSKTHLGYNGGIRWLPDTSQPEYIYTLSADHSLTKKIKLVIEAYGTSLSNHHAQNSADASLLFLLTNNIQADITAGSGIMHSNSEKFAAAGFSIRI
ncbi:transporter [Flavobacterium reichenbachii]|uniref:Transporter n=1 Tax=Flavobacterium reichenbachii TaxID=362418 RepID=A0A085ZEU4_9FLAO|nr:transporter [Flavobacterium reichenbachii]KFF02958.1 hypothetical protein IW19_22730 [Flavobacterium reichenbachii]OXB16952.1 hypothetical protein B0A68_05875 [Flavobacterium reichenbachii]